MEMKGIVGELGEMKIPIRYEARPIKKRPYRLNPIYKQTMKAKIDRMLEAGIIEPVEESEWVILMVVHEKKQGGIRICVCRVKYMLSISTSNFQPGARRLRGSSTVCASLEL
jgi:hypothetical protein